MVGGIVGKFVVNVASIFVGEAGSVCTSQTTGPLPVAQSCSKPRAFFSSLLQLSISDDVADAKMVQDEPYLDTAYEKPEQPVLLSHCSPHSLSNTIPVHASRCSEVFPNRPRSDVLV